MTAVRPTTDRLSPAQRRAIQSQRGRLGLDEETYRRALAAFHCATLPPREGQDWPAAGAPCTSSVHLTRDQARRLITRWTIAGAPVGGVYSGSRPAAQEAAAQGAIALPTPAQRALIERLRAEITWRTPGGYARWIASPRSPVKGGKIATYRDAEAVIDGLKHLRDHRRV